MPIGFGAPPALPTTGPNLPGLLPDIQVLCAFANNPMDDITAIVGVTTADAVATNQWTDLARYVMSIDSCKRGRQHTLDRFEAGRSMLTLWNGDGRFNPWNLASPYTPFVAPQRPAQIRVTWNQIQQRDNWILGTPTWVGTTNTTGPGPSYTAAANGTMTASINPLGGGTVTVTPGLQCSALVTCFSQAATPRLATLNILWLTAGTVIAATASTPALDSPFGTQLSVPQATAPPGADAAALSVTWASCTAGEQRGLGYPQLTRQPGILVWTAPGPLPALPGQPVGAADAWPLFTGYVNQWPINWVDEITCTAQMELIDGFSVINLPDLSSTAYPDAIKALAAQYWRCNDDAATMPSSVGVLRNTIPGPPLIVTDGVAGAVATVGNSGVCLADGSSSALNMGAYNADGGQAWGATTGVGGGPWTWMAWVYGLTQGNVASIAYCPGAGGAWNLQMGTVGAVNSPSIQYAVFDIVTSTNIFVLGHVIVADGNEHMLEVKYDGAIFRFYVDTVLDASITATFTGNPTIYIGGNPTTAGVVAPQVDYAFAGLSITEIAIFNMVTSGAQSAAFYQAAYVFPRSDTGNYLNLLLNLIGWPAAARQIDTGNSTLQKNLQDVSQTSALQQAQLAEQSEGGELFMSAAGLVRFANRHATLLPPYTQVQKIFGDSGHIPFQPAPTLVLDTLDLWNIATVQNVGGLTQTWDNPGSRTSFGPRTFPISGLLLTNDTDALYYAQAIVNQFSVPLTRMRAMTVRAAVKGDGTGHNAIIGRELLDRVKIHRGASSGGGTPFDQEALIESIDHRIDMSTGDWRTTIGVAPTLAQKTWILGTSALNTDTVLAW